MVQASERFLFSVHDAYLHHPESALAPPDVQADVDDSDQRRRIGSSATT